MLNNNEQVIEDIIDWIEVQVTIDIELLCQ